MNKLGILSVLALLLVGVLAVGATALPVVFDSVEVEGTEVSPSETTWLSLERGQDIEVRIEMETLSDVENVEITAFISGYEYNDFEKMSATTHVFDADAGVKYVKTLDLKLPSKVDEDNYLLRIVATDRNGEMFVQNYKLKVDVSRHSLVISDIVFSPEDEVIAGRALLSTVRVKNNGEKDEESVKVRVNVPALGVSASDYIDVIEAGDSTTSEELYIRIPADATPGVYTVEVTVSYDEGYETLTSKRSIMVAAPECVEDACKVAAKADKLVITPAVDTADVKAGETVIFPLTLKNEGSAAKTYVIKVDGTDGWATAKVSPSNVIMLAPDETATAFVYVSTEDKAAGEKVFSVSVSSSDIVLKQIPMKANVVGKATPSFNWETIKTVLLYGFVVLLIILVVLGLVIGFSKLRGKEESEEVSGQTYY